ncbi:MAG: GGDEF domain-containing protein [Lachnospiraceae bacterium]|nr:GGDEF domain-containing protein [Lachnospiraceae bacterium]
MGEGKTQKTHWGEFAAALFLFIAVIAFFFISFVRSGNETAITQAQQKQVNYETVWGGQFSEEIYKAKEFGSIVASFYDAGLPRSKESRVVSCLNNIINNSFFYRIAICDESGVLVDSQEDGSFDTSMVYTGEDRAFYYPSKGQTGKDYSMAINVPVNDGKMNIVFFLDLARVSEKLLKSNLEDSSFLVLFKKDGSICCIFPNFADKESEYIKSGNILTCISEGSKREKFGIFKSELYKGTTSEIYCEYNGEKRWIAGLPLGIDDLYLGFGIKDSQMKKEKDFFFKDTRGLAIRLGIALIGFGIFVSIVSIVIFNKNVAKKKNLENKADTDLLTDLYNKAATEREIQEYIANNPDGRALMFILDIDNFKKVNDTMGHAFGDTLLRTLGKEIRQEFRLTDIIGRTGGDEFIIFLKDINDNLIVEREANRLTRFFHDFKAGGDYVKYSATASIGAAIYPDDADTFKDLYVAADQALYKAKKAGKNQLVFFNDKKNQ